MTPNTVDSLGNLAIAAYGQEKTTVPPDAWVGRVSSYSDQTMDANLKPIYATYTFAAYIRGDDLYPSRNGGDTYYRLPGNRTSSGPGGPLPFIRSSRSVSTDTNGGVSIGYLGGNVSSNIGSSWQYRGFTDMDGDRFPDLIDFGDSQDGASSFAITPGTGPGFGQSITWQTPGGTKWHLAMYTNTSYGFGASFGSAAGGMLAVVGASGRQKSTQVASPDPGASFNVGGGINGSISSSVQTEGFYDLSGSGLPDHVLRSGMGDYLVSLNLGNGNFASPVPWRESGDPTGIDVALFASADNCADKLYTPGIPGLSCTSTGSFGASVSGSIGESVGPVGVGGGISAGLNGTVNQTFSVLTDVNGDGLPDQVVKLNGESFFRVRSNLGDHFGPEVHLFRPEWGSTTAVSLDLSSVVSHDLQTLGDLTGLPLPALGTIVSGGLPNVQSNPFKSVSDPFSVQDDIEYSTGASFNLGANISLSLNFWLLSLTISPGVDGSVATTSATLKFIDIDGDGLPDHVLKLPGENFLRVKRNQSGKSGLIKSLILPQGGTYSFDYTRAGNTIDMPQSRWVLSSFIRDDGMSTIDGTPVDRGLRTYTQTFSYSGGHYDRRERLFYGFAEVAATSSSQAVFTTHYLNQDYYTRGMSAGSDLEGPDSKGNLVLYQQSIINVHKTLQRTVTKASGKALDIYFPNVNLETTRQYQVGSRQFVETTRQFRYDEYGNVIKLDDNGTTGDPGLAMHALITYDLTILGADYQKQSPSSILVEDSSGALMRLRQGTYGRNGELLTLEQYGNPTTSHSFSLTYDQYGNLASIRDPRGHTVAWNYDDQVHTYAMLIRSFNVSGLGTPEYDSALEWDYVLGKKTAEVDQNLQRMRYVYDGFGRLVEVRSPYDTGLVPAVRCQYNTSQFPWTAVTFNKLLYDSSDTQTMRTVIAMDGLGRALQTAKQGEHRDNDGVTERGMEPVGGNCV